MDKKDKPTLHNLKIDVLNHTADTLKTEIDELVIKLDCLCVKYENTINCLNKLGGLNKNTKKKYELSIENISNTQKEINSVEDVVESLTDTDRVWERMNKARENINKQLNNQFKV